MTTIKQPFTQRQLREYLNHIKADTTPKIASLMYAINGLSPAYQNNILQLLIDGIVEIDELLDLQSIDNNTIGRIIAHANDLEGNPLTHRKRILSALENQSISNDLNEPRRGDNNEVLPLFSGTNPLVRARRLLGQEIFNSIIRGNGSLVTTQTSGFYHRIDNFDPSGKVDFSTAENFARHYRRTITKNQFIRGINPEREMETFMNSLDVVTLGIDDGSPDNIRNMMQHIDFRMTDTTAKLVTYAHLVTSLDPPTDLQIKFTNYDNDSRSILTTIKYKTWKSQDDVQVFINWGDGTVQEITPSSNEIGNYSRTDNEITFQISHTYNEIKPQPIQITLFNPMVSFFSQKFIVRLNSATDINEEYKNLKCFSAAKEIRDLIYSEYFIPTLETIETHPVISFSITAVPTANNIALNINSPSTILTQDTYVVYYQNGNRVMRRFKGLAISHTLNTGPIDNDTSIQLYIRIYDNMNFLETIKINLTNNTSLGNESAISYRRKHNEELTLYTNNVLSHPTYNTVTPQLKTKLLGMVTEYTTKLFGEGDEYRQIIPIMIRILSAGLNLEDIDDLDILDDLNPEVILTPLFDMLELHDSPSTDIYSYCDTLEKIRKFTTGMAIELIENDMYLPLMDLQELVYNLTVSHLAALVNLKSSGLPVVTPDNSVRYISPYTVQNTLLTSGLNWIVPYNVLPIVDYEVTSQSTAEYLEEHLLRLLDAADKKPGTGSLEWIRESSNINKAALGLNMMGWYRRAFDDGIAQRFMDVLKALKTVPCGIYNDTMPSWKTFYDENVLYKLLNSQSYFKPFDADVLTSVRNEIIMTSPGYNPNQITETVVGLSSGIEWNFSQRILQGLIASVNSSQTEFSIGLLHAYSNTMESFALRHSECTVTYRGKSVRKTFTNDIVTFNIEDFADDDTDFVEFDNVDISILAIDGYSRIYRLQTRSFAIMPLKQGQVFDYILVGEYVEEYVRFVTMWNRYLIMGIVMAWNKNLLEQVAGDDYGPNLATINDSTHHSLTYRHAVADARMSLAMFYLTRTVGSIQNTVKTLFT
jgi:hypothetical protein